MEKQTGKPEIAAQKRNIKLAPALGDWTTYKPPKVLVKRVKTGLYGFDRLSKEELKLVLLIHYRFIEKLLQRFKIDLKMAVELFSVNVEQTTYLNFMRTLSSPIAQAKIAIPNIHEPVNFVFDLLLGNSIINYGLGSQDLEPINRALTEAENEILTTTLNQYLPDYTKTFRNIFEQPSLEKINSPDATIEQAINTSATYVAFSAEISLADNAPGRIVIGYLGNTIKNLLRQYKQKEPALDFSRLPSAILNKITVPVAIDLGQTTLTTNEINLLEDGDVVSLDTSIKSAVPIKIGNIMKLLCQPGTKDSKLSIRIAGVKDEEQLKVTPPPLTEEAEIETTTEPNAPEPATTPSQETPPEQPAEQPKETQPSQKPEETIEEDFADDDFDDDFLSSEEDSLEEAADEEMAETEDDFLDDDFDVEDDLSEKEE